MSSQLLHLTNLLERLKLEAMMLKTITRERFYWAAIFLVLILVAIEKPNQLYLDLNTIFLNSIASDVENTSSPSEALEVITGIQATLAAMFPLTLLVSPGLSTIQAVSPLIVAGISGTETCYTLFSKNYTILWDEAGILSSFSPIDTPTGWDGSLDCLSNTPVSVSLDSLGSFCDISFVGNETSVGYVAALPVCELTTTPVTDWTSSRFSHIDIRFLLYTTGGEFLFLGK